MVVILVFGTSTTYGAWDIEGGWVQRLRKYLDKKQLADKASIYYMVYNLGVDGNTSTDILERIEFETLQRIKLIEKGEEVITILGAGTNDAIINNLTKKHHVSLEDYEMKIKKIIAVAEKNSTKVLFVGAKPLDESKVDPIPWLPGHSYKNEHIEKYDKRLAEICKKSGILFVEIYNEMRKIKNYEKLLPDGVHPNTEGHRIISEIVINSLVKNKVIS